LVTGKARAREEAIVRKGSGNIRLVLGNRSWDEWVARYEGSHQHPVNRVCHTIGIPVIVVSLVLLAAALVLPALLWPGLGLFVLGWALQFLGHAVERKPPEFFSDWRFLFVGLRWWLAHIRGRA
jgi:uncharacterized membrane protein YGL010W